jgi:predicted ATP-binding protein involved in virulence
MRISNIQIKSLEPFKACDVEFPASMTRGELGEMHLFTGPNGTGKSRLLSLLAASLATRQILALERFSEKIRAEHRVFSNEEIVTSMIGESSILFKVTASRSRMLGFAFSGAFLLNHTSIDTLKGVSLPEEIERLSFNSWVLKDVNQRIANLKVQAAMELMNNAPEKIGRSLGIVRRLESTISEMTGRKFAVIAEAHPTPELKFLWGERKLPIQGLPAGLNSMLSWMFTAATIMDLEFPKSEDPLDEEAFFFLDEPESYLHPEWQRKILPMAQRLFPNSQFFVATHSPFVVSSVNEGFIYKLVPDENGEVSITKAIQASKGDSYISAVSEILDLTEWFDPESEKLLAQFRQERDFAFSGSAEAIVKARSIAESIASRSEELANIMGMELRQLDRKLAQKTAVAKP